MRIFFNSCNIIPLNETSKKSDQDLIGLSSSDTYWGYDFSFFRIVLIYHKSIPANLQDLIVFSQF